MGTHRAQWASIVAREIICNFFVHVVDERVWCAFPQIRMLSGLKLKSTKGIYYIMTTVYVGGVYAAQGKPSIMRIRYAKQRLFSDLNVISIPFRPQCK